MCRDHHTKLYLGVLYRAFIIFVLAEVGDYSTTEHGADYLSGYMFTPAQVSVFYDKKIVQGPVFYG